MTTTPLKATMQVPLLDLKAQYADIKTEIDQAVHRVLDSARFIGGPEVSGLEEEIARYCRTPHAIACASGTDALLLALRALDIGPGDEVVTTAFSFFASAGAIVNAGARPVFVDIDPRTFNLDVHRLEAAITPLTKAVLPVHLYGQCSDLGALKAVCDKRQLYLIEDAAQAIGSSGRGSAPARWATWGASPSFPRRIWGPRETVGWSPRSTPRLPSASVSSASTAPSRSTTTPWSGPTPGWTRCRRRSSASSSITSIAGARSAPRTPRSTTSCSRARGSPGPTGMRARATSTTST
mgnify:CR=1 FL=1